MLIIAPWLGILSQYLECLYKKQVVYLADNEEDVTNAANDRTYCLDPIQVANPKRVHQNPVSFLLNSEWITDGSTGQDDMILINGWENARLACNHHTRTRKGGKNQIPMVPPAKFGP